jgi:hypothetical protein
MGREHTQTSPMWPDRYEKYNDGWGNPGPGTDGIAGPGPKRKMAKKVAVTEAKAQVVADKEALKMNKAARKTDKMSGDREDLKEDRKAMVKKEGKLLKDQVKKDVKVVKEKF